MKREELLSLLEEIGVRPSKEYGQNFLIDDNLSLAIARDAELDPREVVLEIGTGLGVLTRHLVAQAAHVVTVEKDARLAARAPDILGHPGNLTLLEMDALATKNELNPEMVRVARERALAARTPDLPRPLVVAANLPYAVATPLVIGLLAEGLPLARLVVMVQYEVAERFAARPGQDAFGAVSLQCAALAERVRILRRVPREVFYPRPKVTSAVVRLDLRPELPADYPRLEAAIRGLFNYRRKTIARAAEQAAAQEPSLAWLPAAVARSGLDPRLRPDGLDLEACRRIVQAHGA